MTRRAASVSSSGASEPRVTPEARDGPFRPWRKHIAICLKLQIVAGGSLHGVRQTRRRAGHAVTAQGGLATPGSRARRGSRGGGAGPRLAAPSVPAALLALGHWLEMRTSAGAAYDSAALPVAAGVFDAAATSACFRPGMNASPRTMQARAMPAETTSARSRP